MPGCLLGVEVARANLIKRLFESYAQHDEKAFQTAAREIIADERKKHHVLLAQDLERLLSSTDDRKANFLSAFKVPVNEDLQAPLLEIIEPERYMEDLVLKEEASSLLKQVMKEFRSWEVLSSNGLTPSHRILFCGPPGCGKTASAEALATELGLPLLYVRFDGVVSSLLGQTAANLRKVFDFACRGHWILFFDEFDAIGRSRDDPTEHGEIKRVVNTFLQLLDQFRGRSLIIAATNFASALDFAVWRRFDEVLRFELPKKRELECFVERNLRFVNSSKKQLTAVANALQGKTFADAERVCRDLHKSCVLDGRKELKSEDVANALTRLSSREKVLSCNERELPAIDRE